jgi:hypothetical protein
MASNIIDSLFIELGLDATKFDTAQKKSVEELRKFETQATKTSKETQLNATKMADGFDKVKGALLGFTAAAVGAAGFKEFVINTIAGNVALGRQAQMLGLSAQEIKAWGGVVEKTGGSLEGFEGSLNNIETGLARVKFGDTGILTVLGQLQAFDAVDVQKNTVDIYKLSDALVRFKEAHGIQSTMSLAKQIGLDEGTILTLLKGRNEISALHDASFKLFNGIDKNVESATRLNNKWVELKNNAGALGQTLSAVLEPAMGKTLDFINKGLENNKKKAHEAVYGDDYDDTHDRKAGQYSASQSHGGAIGGAPASVSGLPRNMRNHNPGNIEYGKFAIAHGATGSDGRFAIFPDDATGFAAQSALLSNKIHGGNDTIAKLVESWSPSKENGSANTNAYISDLSKKTGIDPNAKLTDSQIGALQQAQAAHEGWLGSKVNSSGGSTSSNSQSEVNINSMVVNTQATDAQGTAAAMKDALANNAFINAGTRGAS